MVSTVGGGYNGWLVQWVVSTMGGEYSEWVSQSVSQVPPPSTLHQWHTHLRAAYIIEGGFSSGICVHCITN